MSTARDTYSELSIRADFFSKYEFTPHSEKIKGTFEHRLPEKSPKGEAKFKVRFIISVTRLLNSISLFGEQAGLRLIYDSKRCELVLNLFDDGFSKVDSVDYNLGLGVISGCSECIMKTADIEEDDEIPDIQKNFLYRKNNDGFVNDGPNMPQLDFLSIAPWIIRYILLDMIMSYDEEMSRAYVSMNISPRVKIDDMNLMSDDDHLTRTYASKSCEIESFISFSLIGNFLSRQWNLHSDSQLIYKYFVRKSHRNDYRLNCLSSILPALKLAHALKIEISDSGILSLQLVVKKKDLTCRVIFQFYIFPTTGAMVES